ncbi:MAG TPA: peptidoglycan-binding protein [Rhodobacteraceae bacterium]|nr:peptidoglycan-binding protein [Paracoccaceae bacterium]
MRPFNEVSIVGLIITSGEETPVSASVTQTLESLDAQVLTANAPNASQMRSILKRFAGAALDVDVALVFYDGAVLKIGDREFVAPGGITLRRRSDLLTKAIPLSALARATALAGNGGAVLVHSSESGVALIDGITLVANAPGPRTGTSPILFANATAAEGLAAGLESMTAITGDISLRDALRGLSELGGVSISQLPSEAAMLRVYPAPEVVDTIVAATPETMDTAETTDATADAAEMAETTDETGLPQVGDATPDADSAADVAATVEALENGIEAETITDETMAEASDGTEMADVAVETQSTEVGVAVDSELSIEVLRAMQGALTRGQKRTIQQKLRNMRYYRGLIDGIFGPQTARAISAYQESVGATVTGVLTPIQLEALSE